MDMSLQTTPACCKECFSCCKKIVASRVPEILFQFIKQRNMLEGNFSFSITIAFNSCHCHKLKTLALPWENSPFSLFCSIDQLQFVL